MASSISGFHHASFYILKYLLSPLSLIFKFFPWGKITLVYCCTVRADSHYKSGHAPVTVRSHSGHSAGVFTLFFQSCSTLQSWSHFTLSPELSVEKTLCFRADCNIDEDIRKSDERKEEEMERRRKEGEVKRCEGFK